jgi:hypothetical protein
MSDFDLVAVDRHTSRQSVWRVRGCATMREAQDAARRYNNRHNAEHILGAPEPADPSAKPSIEVLADGYAAHETRPAASAQDRGAAIPEGESVRLDHESIRRLQWAVFRAIMLAWLAISVVSGLLWGLIISAQS